jgi:hypothetical protein
MLGGEEPPLVQLSVELLPKGPKKVVITARALDVVFSIPLVLRIRDFFSSGGAADALANLREDAVSAAARAIISKAKVPLHLSVKIDAPNVVFCDSFANWPHCTKLIGALGRLTLTSTEEDLYLATISNIRAFVGLPALAVWQDALTGPASSNSIAVLEETSLDVEIRVKHGIRVHSEATVCVTGTFSTPPRVHASTDIVVDIVRVSLGLALSAIELDRTPVIDPHTLMAPSAAAASSSTSIPSKTAVQVELLMPSIEIVASSLAGDDVMARLLLSSTLLSVHRDFVGRVDVSLGLGSLTAMDCLGTSVPRRMVWSEATDSSQKHVTLRVTSWPGDGAVDVDLDLFKMNLALQRQTTLEVLSFSEILATTISGMVPPQLRAKKTDNASAHNVGFNLRTGDVQIALLRGGSPFLHIGLAASKVTLQEFKDDRMHLELLLGAFCLDNPMTVGPYRRLLATTGDHTAAITVDTFKKDASDRDVAVEARVFSVTLFFLSRVLKDLAVYFSELEEMVLLLRAKAGQVAASAVRSKMRASLKLDVEVATLVLPVSSDLSACFLARMQHLSLNGNPDGRLDLMVTGLTAASAQFVEGSKFSEVRPMLNEWSTRLAMERSVMGAEWGTAPDLAVSCHSEDALSLAVDGDQVALLFDLLEKNLLQSATPDDDETSGLDVTVTSMKSKFKNSSVAVVASADAAVDAIALPVWIRVRLVLADVLVSFGAAKDVGLGVFQGHGMALNMDSFDQMTVSLDLKRAELKDARSEASGSIKLLESVSSGADSNLFELRFRKALGELDDLGLTVGEVCLVLDPKWLLALVHVMLPILDRMLSLSERLQDSSFSLGDAKKPVVSKGEGTHLVLKVLAPRAVALESDAAAPRALALSSSMILLERTEIDSGKSCLNLQFREVAVWKTRFGTTDRASILSPVLITMAWEEVSEEVASMTFSVGKLSIDFSYQDLILTHSLAVYWMSVWGERKKDDLDGTTTRPRQISRPPPVAVASAENPPTTPVQQVRFRLELSSNRAFVASVHDHPPKFSLEKRSDLSVQLVRFSDGRVVFDMAQEVNWCVTVEGLPGTGAGVAVSQEHPAKVAVQLWDWLPVSPASLTEGRLVLRSHASWCLAVADVGSSTIEEFLPFELEQAADECASRQVWHLPAWVAQSMPMASPSPLVTMDSLTSQAQRQRLQEQLVLPDRWNNAARAPPRAQQVSVHLTGLSLHVVDDLAGNVRPIARLAIEEASLQVANWSNGGDLHCVFTIALQADYFNEDSEAWEPLLRGMEDVTSQNGKEKSLDVQLSVNRAGEVDEKGRKALLKGTLMTSQSISITVSRALVPTAIRLWEAWDDRKQNAQATVSRPAPLPPRLRNQTGQPIRWRSVRKADDAGSLESEEAVNLSMLSVYEKSVIGLRIGNGRWLACPIDSVKSHAFRLDDGLTAVVEVEKHKNGLREVMVRSNVVIENKTDHPLVISLQPREVVVAAGASFPVPFESLHLPLKLCPETQMYLLSDKSLIAGALLQTTPLKAVDKGSKSKRANVETRREDHSVFRCQHTLGGASWTWAVEVKGIMTDDSARAWTWRVECRPPLTLRNLLQGPIS